MTAREVLDRRKRWVMGVIYGGLALFLFGFFGQRAMGLAVPALMIVGLAGFAVAWLVGMIAQFVGFRCPCCRGNLAPFAMWQGGVTTSRKMRFCPFCGIELDSELEAQPADLADDWG